MKKVEGAQQRMDALGKLCLCLLLSKIETAVGAFLRISAFQRGGAGQVSGVAKKGEGSWSTTMYGCIWEALSVFASYKNRDGGRNLFSIVATSRTKESIPTHVALGFRVISLVGRLGPSALGIAVSLLVLGFRFCSHAKCSGVNFTVFVTSDSRGINMCFCRANNFVSAWSEAFRRRKETAVEFEGGVAGAWRHAGFANMNLCAGGSCCSNIFHTRDARGAPVPAGSLRGRTSWRHVPRATGGENLKSCAWQWHNCSLSPRTRQSWWGHSNTARRT